MTTRRQVFTSLLQEVVNGYKEETKCWCFECLKDYKAENGLPVILSRMILCPDCGNKRCPKATNHRLACTNSNDSGQQGSRYA
jgi:hypothetical protein